MHTRLSIFFLLLSLTLYSEQGNLELSSNNVELATVNDCVNVIGGDFFLAHQAVQIGGPDPLLFQLIYDSKNRNKSEFGFGQMNSLRSCYIANHWKESAWLVQHDGNTHSWKVKKVGKKWQTEVLGKEKNWWNTNLHTLETKRNHSPFIMTGALEKKKRCTIQLSDGTRQHYMFDKKEMDDQYYYLRYEELPSGNKRYYFYDLESKYYALKQVSTYNADKSLRLNTICFDEEKRKVKVTGSNGQYFTAFKEPLRAWNRHGNYPVFNTHKVLDSFLSSHLHDGKFVYKDTTKTVNDFKMKNCWHPDGYWMQIDYNSAGKVRTLSAPIGKGAEQYKQYHFHYKELGEIEEHRGRTEVVDAHKNSTFYFHTYCRITNILHPKLRQYNFHWDKKGQLLKQTVTNLKTVCLENRYKYDAKGNPIEKILAGNLTGTSSKKEEAKTVCTYSKDRFNNLLTEQLPNGSEINYSYVPGTNLLASKLTIGEGRIQLREFFTYDKNAICTEHLKDDGSGKSASDLKNVTYRTITRITPQLDSTKDGFIQPAAKEELYLDLATNQERLLRREEYLYVKGDLLAERRVFDADGTYRYSIYLEYDSKRRPVKEINPIGEEIKTKYNFYGKKEYEEKVGTGYHTSYFYDTCKRLVKEKEYHHSDKSVLTTTHSYNLLSQKIWTKNPYGDVTSYKYDAFGRCIEESFDGHTEKKRYNVLDQVIETVDFAGNKKLIGYNIRGKPVRIIYPDGSEERYHYTLFGSLAKKIEKDGTYHTYSYDYLGRALTQETYSAKGEPLRTLKNRYKGELQIESVDGNGVTTTFTYDNAGRKIQEEKAGHTLFYSYDALGRLYKTDHGPYVEIQEFDPLDRVIEERVEDQAGTLISKVQYSYDIHGKKSHIRTFIDENTYAEEITLHDSCARPILHIDAAGNETHTAYSMTDHLEKITVDPKGIQTIETFDASGNVIKVERLDIQGVHLSLVENSYDPNSRKILEEHHILENGESHGIYEINYSYDSMGNLLMLREQGIKTTTHTYKNGRCISTTKPNGIILNYSYDALGRRSSLTSSDKTVHYSYTYDNNDNLLTSTDHIHHRDIARSYDAHNQVIEETLDGITSHYRYDTLGRPLEWSSETLGSVQYTFGAYRLDAVTRRSSTGETLYTHHYLEKDLTGRPLKSQMIKEAGEITYSYDESLRPTSIKTAHFEQTFDEDSFDSKNQLRHFTQRDPLGVLHPHFGYDDLSQISAEEGVISRTYSHDSLANRRSDHTINSLNQVTFDGSNHYQYDRAGNLVQINDTQLLYDALGRLIQYGTTHYTYDSENRRRTKVTPDETLFFLYQNSREVGSLSESGELLQFRTLGRGIQADVGAAIALELNGKTYAPVHDHRGNLVLLLDPETGAPVETYRFSAFGLEEGSETPLSPWRFSSKREEDGLLYFGERYYSPTLGKFITPDPSGFTDGPNLYAYTLNNPLTLIDPEGLMSFSYFFKMYGYENVMNGYMRACHYHYFDEPLNYENHTMFDTVGKKQTLDYSVGFVPGMRNTREDALAHGRYISKTLGGINVDVVSNATFGLLHDTIESFLNYLGFSTTPVKLIHQAWDNHFDNKNGPYLQYCTSQGSILVNRALQTYPEERRKRIHVRAIANADYIHEDDCGSSKHIASRWDVVTMFRFDKRIMARLFGTYHLNVLEPHPCAPRFDHSIQSPTFEKHIMYEYYEFKQNVEKGVYR